jgi:hypothetical protein
MRLKTPSRAPTPNGATSKGNQKLLNGYGLSMKATLHVHAKATTYQGEAARRELCRPCKQRKMAYRSNPVQPADARGFCLGLPGAVLRASLWQSSAVAHAPLP